MADNFCVEFEKNRTDFAALTQDYPDGITETVDTWLRDLRRNFREVFKDAKTTLATGVLGLFATRSGREGNGAAKGLALAGGPKSKSDRIAIIGGGPAGVHMAYALSKAGFTNITIFEKSDRVGGKSHSVEQEDGMVQEMGTCYLSPDYSEIKQLMSHYKCDEQAKVIGRTVWDPDHKSSTGLDFQEWLCDAIRGACKSDSSNLMITVRLLKECVHYIQNHHDLFGRYEGFLMAEPPASVLGTLDCSIAEYLDRIGCCSLKPIFTLAYTLQGYGYLETTPALYGLLWVTPKLLVGLVEQLKVRSNLPPPHQEAGTHERSITILLEGWGKLWTSIIEDESLGIECRLNVDIAKPIIRDDDGICITYHTRRRVQDGTTMTSLAEVEKFDFLVVAAPMQNILPLLDHREDEQRLFSGLRPATFVTTLCNYSPTKDTNEAAIDSWLDNVAVKRPPFSVWSARDSHHVRHVAGKLKNVKRPDLHGSMVVYQYADLDCATVDAEGEAAAAFKAHFAKHTPNGSELQIVNIEYRNVWSYFPRHSQRALCDGILWRLLERQGEYKTWYTGACTCFESINAITGYNHMLVDTWIDQMPKDTAV